MKECPDCANASQYCESLSKATKGKLTDCKVMITRSFRLRLYYQLGSKEINKQLQYPHLSADRKGVHILNRTMPDYKETPFDSLAVVNSSKAKTYNVQCCIIRGGSKGSYVSPSKVSKVPHPYPLLLLWFCSLLRIAVSRSLSFLGALVCDLLPRWLFHGLPKAHCPKSISVTILTSTAWEDTRLIWYLSYPRGGHH